MADLIDSEGAVIVLKSNISIADVKKELDAR